MLKHLIRQITTLFVMWSLLALTTTTMIGCAHTGGAAQPPQSPQIVFTQSLLTASEANLLVSDGLVTADKTIEQLHKSGAADDAYYASADKWIKAIAQANDKAIAAVRAAQSGDTSTDWKSAMLNISKTAMSFDPTVYGFKNPDTQAAVKVAIASLQSAIAAISASYGGTR